MANPFKTVALSIWTYRSVRLALAAVFLVSGAIKLMDTAAFAAILHEYRLLPRALIGMASVGLPLFEVAAGAALVFNLRASLTCITLLLLVFIGAIWWGVIHNLNIDCGCFGPEELAEQGSLRRALYRDIVMLLGCAYLYAARVLKPELRPGFPSLFNRAR